MLVNPYNSSTNSCKVHSASKSPYRMKSNFYKHTPRLNQLSQPKISQNDCEEVVGPGTYSPKDCFLSTNNKSPTIAIGRSERFIKIKVPMMRESITKHLQEDKSLTNNYLACESPPSYSFKRTGHNLKLVTNPDVPGVGRYTPNSDSGYNGFSFSKASKQFNWKKGM